MCQKRKCTGWRWTFGLAYFYKLAQNDAHVGPVTGSSICAPCPLLWKHVARVQVKTWGMRGRDTVDAATRCRAGATNCCEPIWTLSRVRPRSHRDLRVRTTGPADAATVCACVWASVPPVQGAVFVFDFFFCFCFLYIWIQSQNNRHMHRKQIPASSLSQFVFSPKPATQWHWLYHCFPLAAWLCHGHLWPCCHEGWLKYVSLAATLVCQFSLHIHWWFCTKPKLFVPTFRIALVNILILIYLFILFFCISFFICHTAIVPVVLWSIASWFSVVVFEIGLQTTP